MLQTATTGVCGLMRKTWQSCSMNTYTVTSV
nr:MAG TPA: hypothetical protein [Caudoviricetes sp.]